MKRLISFALCCVLLASLSATAFAQTDVEVGDEDYYTRFQGQNISISVYNWGEYISDGSDDTLDVNAAFEALTGIKVLYTTFATNEELYAKLKSGGASYDIIIPSDYMVARMIAEEMVQPLDFGNIPNVQFLDEQYLYTDFDPEGAYSVPYTWGTVGIIYNTLYVDEEDTHSWDLLWDDRYMGEILMFSNPRDSFSIALKRLGYSMNSTDEAELQEACESLKDQKALVQAYVMDEIFDKMEGEEAMIAPYYAGDAIIMADENPNLAFSIPDEGTNRFIDSICIPANAKQKEAAEMYINFLCEPEVAAANIDFIGYSTPNLAAYELLDEEMQQNAIAYPSQEVLDNTEAFIFLPTATSTLMDKLWTEILSNDENYSKWTIPAFLLAGILFSIGINVRRTILKKKENLM
ncbi:MAG: spermidine/putrescine ABC transporter substrate-binding protein [Oscillospiraceae bacterium]|nr:spermidine/putrescine ABC transporter substrate-binding protein [Oscillospiraceae bacterium]